MFILPNVGSTHVAGLKFTHCKVINSQIIVVQLMYNQHCLFVKKQKNNDLPSLPFTSVQVAQQSEIAAGVLVTEFLQQTLTISWIDGGEVAAVDGWLSLRFSLNQRY